MSEKPILSQSFVRLTLILLAFIYASVTLRLFTQPITALLDFDAFYIAGQMVWDGTIEQAYQTTLFYQRQKDVGRDLSMPWTYPPPFNMIVAPLALLPRPIAYAVFIGPVLIAYVLTLHRLAGRFLPFVLAASCPALVATIMTGQNGLLTATLLGLISAGLLQGHPFAGVPLGLMIIKPHLAVATSLIAVLRLPWRVLAVASATVLSVVTLSIWVFGPQIWMAFLDAMREAKALLSDGKYHFYLMASVYAALKSLGFAVPVAFAGQIVVAVSMLGLVTWAALGRLPLRDTLGLAVITAPLITPYVYDYDLCLLGVGLALLGPTIEGHMTRRTQASLLLLIVMGCGASFVQHIRRAVFTEVVPNQPEQLASLGAWPLLLAVALIAYTMWRAQRASPATALVAPVTRPASA